MWTHGNSFGGGGILTSDNHNSLYTRATVSPPPVTLPPSLFLLFRSSRPRLDSPFSLSFPLSLFSSLLCHVVPSPLGPRSSCCIDHGYSAIVFNLPCSCCGCRLQENFACLSLLRTLLEFLSFSLFPFLSFVSFIVHPFLPLAAWHPRLASISRAIAPSSGLLRLLPPFALPFILEMDIGIHETKLMITTSKQRRTTNSYLSILLPASPFHL